MGRQKLDIDKQIEHMESRGIKFNIVSKAEARQFLTHSTYYFKLKAFAKNYDTYIRGGKAGQYVNLEFAYLKELSTLDMHLRKMILSMTVDIEHFLKVKLLSDISLNQYEDGYNIINIFFVNNPQIYNNVSYKCACSVTSDLVKKFCDDWAVWNIIEVLSFGDFIKLYTLYYVHYQNLYANKETYVCFLGSAKFLRNAAAHNNCLLNSLSTPYLNAKCRKLVCHFDGNLTSTKYFAFRMTKKLSDIITNSRSLIGITDTARRKMLQNPVLHDLTAIVYLYSQVCSSGSVKATNKNLHAFLERCKMNSIYFTTNQAVISSFLFFEKIVDFYLKDSDT